MKSTALENSWRVSVCTSIFDGKKRPDINGFTVLCTAVEMIVKCWKIRRFGTVDIEYID